LKRTASKLKNLSTTEKNLILDSLAKACNVGMLAGKSEHPMLSWDEVSHMASHGVSFGGHTVSHPNLSVIIKSEARNEIFTSKLVIEERTQKPVNVFAYPYGTKEDYNDNVVRLVEEAGFQYACTTNAGFEKLPIQTPLTLKKKGGSEQSLFVFLAIKP
jgi:peptidoglycan/xylan/chitin deacetylase (PgdA/CDA1 family)